MRAVRLVEINEPGPRYSVSAYRESRPLSSLGPVIRRRVGGPPEDQGHQGPTGHELAPMRVPTTF